MSEEKKSEFEKAAAEGGREGFLAETWAFMKENKKWWLLPILLVVGLVGLLTIFASSGAAPFIYTLF